MLCPTWLGDSTTSVLARIDKTGDANFADLLPDRWKPPPKPAPSVDFDAA